MPASTDRWTASVSLYWVQFFWIWKVMICENSSVEHYQSCGIIYFVKEGRGSLKENMINHSELWPAQCSASLYNFVMNFININPIYMSKLALQTSFMGAFAVMHFVIPRSSWSLLSCPSKQALSSITFIEKLVLVCLWPQGRGLNPVELVALFLNLLKLTCDVWSHVS